MATELEVWRLRKQVEILEELANQARLLAC